MAFLYPSARQAFTYLEPFPKQSQQTVSKNLSRSISGMVPRKRDSRRTCDIEFAELDEPLFARAILVNLAKLLRCRTVLLQRSPRNETAGRRRQRLTAQKKRYHRQTESQPALIVQTRGPSASQTRFIQHPIPRAKRTAARLDLIPEWDDRSNNGGLFRVCQWDLLLSHWSTLSTGHPI
jgi:hypothetical protein